MARPFVILSTTISPLVRPWSIRVLLLPGSEAALDLGPGPMAGVESSLGILPWPGVGCRLAPSLHQSYTRSRCQLPSTPSR